MSLQGIEKLLHDLRVKIKSDTNISMAEHEERITAKINENIDQKFNYINSEIEKIKQTNEDQEKRIGFIEKQLRERNIIFFGIEEGEKSYVELEENIIKLLRKMDINCNKSEIEIVRRMGKRQHDKIRPVNLTLTTYGKNILILKNKKKLEDFNIYIKEDFAPKILEVRKSLHEQLLKERNAGKVAYLRYDKSVIKDQPPKPNMKKRELQITPPHEKNPTGTRTGNEEKKHRTYKNNNGSVKTSQSSISNFVQKNGDKQTQFLPSTSTTLQE